ncbi:MAG TPA: hypothetical protein VH518_03400 [Tepidisphaeraceae bacterium]|jgi:hypothetical protein
MIIELNGFALELSLLASKDGRWTSLPLNGAKHEGIKAELILEEPTQDRIGFTLRFSSPFRTRLRLRATLRDQQDLFHLIPGNIHGDNNEAHVRSGEFPCLTRDRTHERNRSPLWEFRADRASHPVSILCGANGAVGISIEPYSASDETKDGFIRNGVFAALPDAFGVSLGYGNDPLTFSEKTVFLPETSNQVHHAEARGTIFGLRGEGRLAAHRIVRALHEQMRDLPRFEKSYRQALRALADSFAAVNFSPELGQYTNRKCRVPVDTTLKPWRAIVEIGWTGGSMLAYPFALAEGIFPDLRMPKSSTQIFDEICGGFNEASGFINDATINRHTQNRPADWNQSTINGWWSGFLPQTRDNHCAYTNAHAAYYMLRAVARTPTPALPRSTRGGGGASPPPLVLRGRAGVGADHRWTQTALKVLNTAIALQRPDGAFGYIFSSTERKVIDFDGFAGCWFAAALPLAWQITGETRYRISAAAALDYYWPFVRALNCWGSPMDTFKSVDSEGNLAFLRAARHMHEFTGESKYLQMLENSAHYEYLWRYGFRTRPQCPPLKGSNWNSCGGSITSVSNPHIHPMSVVATADLEYLARLTNDSYHQSRADDGMAWLMNTMELYPAVMGYGQYGVLSERTCPSDGLLAETFADDGLPASTWWSYNAWAAGSAMEAIAEQILAARPEPR